MNELTYVATKMETLESGRPYGSFCRVLVNGDWRFAIYPTDSQGYTHVVMLTRTNENGNWQAAGFDILAVGDMLDRNLTELAQLLPPF